MFTLNVLQSIFFSQDSVQADLCQIADYAYMIWSFRGDSAIRSSWVISYVKTVLLSSILECLFLHYELTAWLHPLLPQWSHWNRTPLITWQFPLFSQQSTLGQPGPYSVGIHAVYSNVTHHINSWWWRQRHTLKCWILTISSQSPKSSLQIILSLPQVNILFYN